MLNSVVCRHEHFSAPWYERWTRAMQLGPLAGGQTYHRKVWEFAAILATLEERGKLQAGLQGLGFAVGTEPLPALLAAHGVDVVATDVAPGTNASRIWTRTNQHGASADALFRPELIDRARFDERVRFRHVDMNEAWDFAEGSFDFVWSSCALEHLGTLERGVDFIRRSARLLKRGGIAVHTTEYNCSSNDRTTARGGGVLYRKRDIEDIDRRLRLDQRCLAPLDFWPGDSEADRIYDVPPYSQSGERQHVKILIDGYVCTSMLLTVVG